MLVCAVDVLIHIRYTRVSDVFHTSFDEMFTGIGVACIREDGAKGEEESHYRFVSAGKREAQELRGKGLG